MFIIVAEVELRYLFCVLIHNVGIGPILPLSKHIKYLERETETFARQRGIRTIIVRVMYAAKEAFGI